MFYYLLLFSICILTDYRVSTNLYSNLDNKLDEITNYVKRKVEEKTSPSISKIYENTRNLFHNRKIRNENEINFENYKWSSDDLYELRAIKKLFEFFPSIKLKKELSVENFDDTSLQNNKKYKKTIYKRDDSNLLQQIKGSSNILNSMSPALYPNVVSNLPMNNVPNYNSLPSNINSNDFEKKLQEIQNSILPSIQTQTAGLSKLSVPNPNIDANLNANNKLVNLIAANNNLPQIQNQNVVDAPSERLKHNMDLICDAPKNNSKESSDLIEENRHLAKILDKLLVELQAIRQCKTENKSINGGPCDITGSWNSEVIGLRFDINPSNDGQDFLIRLQDRYPKKRHTIIQPDWKSSGSAIHRIGGPLFMTSKKCEEHTLATFAGLCRTCGGIDMIFGIWTFVRPAKDCEDIQVAIENRRDIFRRSLLNEKKRKRLEQIRRSRH